MEKTLKGGILTEYPFGCVLSLGPLIEYLHRDLAVPGAAGRFCLSDDFTRELEQAPELAGPIRDESLLDNHRELVSRLMSFVFAPVFWETEPVGALVPFTARSFFVSPAFERMFLRDDRTFILPRNITQEEFDQGRAMRAYLKILSQFYGVDLRFDFPLISIVPCPKTGLDRYYNYQLDLRFIKAYALSEPPKLSDEELSFVVDHITEPAALKSILPPEMFEFRGFSVIHAVDVTETEVISDLQRDLIDREAVVSRAGFNRLQERLRVLFRRPDLLASLAAMSDDQVLMLNAGCHLDHSCIFGDSIHVPMSRFEGTVYEKVVDSEEIIIVPDVTAEPSLADLEQDFLQVGVRSTLIAPLHFQGECVGTLSIKSPTPGDLGPMDAMVLSHIQPLFAMAVKKSLGDVENQVQAIIKEKCTAIHPSVEWRFRQAAFKHLAEERAGRPGEIEPIVFKDVFPIYGSSDIRGSADERNRAIQSDLTEQLGLALEAVKLADAAHSLPILRELAGRIESHVNRVGAGLTSGDELVVVGFLKREVEAIFPDLRGLGPKVLRAIDAYQAAIDPNLGMVYRRRREFEQSVLVLNERLAIYLDQEAAVMQESYPHYFERHRTDGVDYLGYLGASLNEDGRFNELYLRNMRLWQIMVACGLAWLTEQLKSSLSVALDTAHLILVQNSPLSIRFRYDEKRFDVDGAYDVRHEIVRSRIDKAVIKGGERLTQPGKIAIVYTQADEAEEMMRHVDYLRSDGYLTDEVDRLDLEDLPGVQGLKAIRVGINLESEALSGRFERVAV